MIDSTLPRAASWPLDDIKRKKASVMPPTTQIEGTAGNDVLNGTTGNDLILGFGGNDRLNGLAGDDTLNGGSGTNQIDAGDGNDTVIVDGTAVNGAVRVPATGIDGGAGVDTIQFTGAVSDYHIVQIAGGPLEIWDLTTGSRNIAVNIEHLQFSDTEILLVPQNVAPVVSGDVTASATEGSGLLTVTALTYASDANAGDVLSVTGLGTLPEGVTFDAASQSFVLDPSSPAFNALAAGETQNVRIDYGVTDGSVTTAAAVVVTITGTNDVATVAGDTKGAASEDGTLSVTGQMMVTDPDRGEAGFAAVSRLAGTYGSLNIDAAGSWTYALNNNALAVQSLGTGVVVNDVLSVHTADGTTAQITVAITGAADTGLFVGTGGADRLTGTAADDHIFGLAGADEINGKAGDDVLTGGAGADQFIFAARFGHNIVTDFDTSLAGETINLSSINGLHRFADLNANHLTEVAGDAILTFGTATITLDGVSAASLTANDFLF